jgi:hypothetical protein
MEEDKAKLKHGNSTMPKKKSILSQRFGANSSERMEMFFAGHMPSLTYLSTIHKYYSTSSTSSYVCTCRHVGNSQKQHDIDGPKMEQERQMLPNVGPTCLGHVSDMSSNTSMLHQNCQRRHPTNPTKVSTTIDSGNAIFQLG